jgi:hypothetical protein
MLTGVYMRTGVGAGRIVRKGIYSFLGQTLADSPLHAHIVAGTMNAALFTADQMEGRRGQYDADYQVFTKESRLLPFDQQQAVSG